MSWRKNFSAHTTLNCCAHLFNDQQLNDLIICLENWSPNQLTKGFSPSGGRMRLTRRCPLLLLLLQTLSSSEALSFAKIVNSSYSSGVAFAQSNVLQPTVCYCSCINQPHCLSISLSRSVGASGSYFCQLFATYPNQPNQLSSSSNSNVSVFTDRTSRSAKILLDNKLISPPSLFPNDSNAPWIPLLLLRSGNNQSFLWFNSSSATSLSTVPDLFVNASAAHWFSILISQWNQGTYRPSQVALAFFLNQSSLIDFLVFNASQSDIFSWFSIARLVSNQFWSILQYQGTAVGDTYIKAIYQDANCTRSFNSNFKYSSTSCAMDFYGYFFVYGGFRDQCIGAVRTLSQVPIPSIFYSPTENYTSGSLNQFSQAFGLMVFVR